MAAGIESGNNKAKVAKRVVEVLEFFDEEHPRATVMDLVRRYKWPQSSTSELLSSLVDLGLLYKDCASRTYSLTPRAAMLGSTTQPDLVRDGRLTREIERLAAQTGLNVGVFGMVGLRAQIFNWRSGLRGAALSGDFCGGAQDQLNASAAGWLLLSTVAQPQRDGIVRRLNAEADAQKKFSFPDMCARLQDCRGKRVAVGPAGFGSKAEMAAVLLSAQGDDEHPMVVGLVYEPSEQIDREVLIHCLKETMRRCQSDHEQGSASIRPFVTAA